MKDLKPAASFHFSRRYQLGKKLGNGRFGEVYLARDSEKGNEVAIKLERSNPRTSKLSKEFALYHMLAGGVGVPKVHLYAVESELNMLVIELLGPSLEKLLATCRHRFSMKSILMLADQLITRVETLHKQGYIHRDVKPENFLIGLNKTAHIVYITDFGLSKLYLHPETRLHIQKLEGKSLVGTARYASINAQLGIEQSRRDDMESLFYSLIYFFRGSLPWTELRTSQAAALSRMLQLKLNIPVERLCSGMPSEFSECLQYCRALEFEETPNYLYLKRMLRDLFKSMNYDYDFIYDWTTPAPNPTGWLEGSESDYTEEETKHVNPLCIRCNTN